MGLPVSKLGRYIVMAALQIVALFSLPCCRSRGGSGWESCDVARRSDLPVAAAMGLYGEFRDH